MGRKMMGGMEQRELVFHNTVPLSDVELAKAIVKAKEQKAKVLLFFERDPSKNYTPSEVHYWMGMLWGEEMLLTSVRRCITNLTKEGRLIKCQWSESKEGAYGKLNRTWRYNQDYISPLNPK